MVGFGRKLVILSAPSGAGKTTIARSLLEAGLGLEFSVSACSREMRVGEVDGKDYYFISPDEFRMKIEQQEFIEWEEVYPDHYYGTLKSELERIWSAGNQVLFDVDVYGGIALKKIFKQQALSIFIRPPDIETLKSRLLNRSSDSEEKIIMRLNKAKEEISLAGQFDIQIINDQLDAAVQEALNLASSFLKE